MKRNIGIFALAVLLMTAVLSCEKPVPVPEDPDKPDTEQPDSPKPDEPRQPELKDNEYMLGDKVSTFGSVAAGNLGEYLCIAASPSEGVEGLDAIFEQDEYFYVAISPLLSGKGFDLMTEERLYTVISTLEGVSLETVAPSMTEEIEEGTCTFSYVDGVASVEIAVKLAGGVSFSAKLSAEEPALVVNENIFSIGGDDKPVRTAFRLVEDGVTALYLTPAGIDYFEDLGITTYYAYIILDDSQCHGRTLSVSDVIAVGYADNFNEFIVDSGEVETKGTLNVSADPDDPAHYVVSADLDFAGTTLKLRFDGTTIDAYAKEVVNNELVYDGEVYAITSAVLNLMPSAEGTCNVMLTTAKGEILSITLPLEFFDGNAHGFSQSQHLYMEYDGKTFSKASGYSGTVTVSAQDGVLKVEATNYDNLSVTYEGSYEEVC